MKPLSAFQVKIVFHVIIQNIKIIDANKVNSYLTELLGVQINIQKVKKKNCKRSESSATIFFLKITVIFAIDKT